MITLITGTPGAGKTLYAVSELLPTFKGRPLFVDGVPDLLIDHEQPAGPVCDESTGWHDWLPDNGVLVVDEAQRVFRPRPASSKVPPAVAALETHRHRGADILLITQHPNLLDSNIRRLVGRHLHVRRVWGWKRSVIYEWDQATDPNRVATAQKTVWSYNKKAFGLYRSATVHTNRGQKPPILFWLIPAMALAVAAGGWKAYGWYRDKINPPAHQTAAKTATPTAGLSAAAGPSASALSQPGWNYADVIPRHPDHPESAPMFDGLRKVVSMPEIQVCIASRSRCQCYTQQQTKIDISDAMCRRYAAGEVFDPYRQDAAPSVSAPAKPSPLPNKQDPLQT